MPLIVHLIIWFLGVGTIGAAALWLIYKVFHIPKTRLWDFIIATIMTWILFLVTRLECIGRFLEFSK